MKLRVCLAYVLAIAAFRSARAQFTSIFVPGLSCSSNLFCRRDVANNINASCLTPSQLCDGTQDCPDGADEGLSTLDNDIECNTGTTLGPMYRCSANMRVPITDLCDGTADCSGGEDETRAVLCLDKCRPTYSGGCSEENPQFVCVPRQDTANCDCNDTTTFVRIGNACIVRAIRIGWTVTTLMEAEPGTARVCAQVLDGDITLRTFTLDVATVAGTATASADYTPLPAGTQITINSNAEVCLNIGILNDNEVESNEDFTVVLSDPTNNVDLTVDPDTLTITITDDDVVVVRYRSAPYSFLESAGSVNNVICVEIESGTTTQDTVINFASTDDTTSPNDYSLVTMMNSVTFSSGSTMGNFECIEINIVEDQRLEADEVFDLTISSSNANVMINGATTTVTIEDNDSVTIGFDPSSYTVTEGPNTIATVTISLLQGELERDATVLINCSPGTAMAVDDFTAVINSTHVFTSSVSSWDVDIMIANDDVVENDESFTCSLSTSDGDVTLNPASATITIEDDDGATVSFGQQTYSVVEGNSLSVTVGYSGTKAAGVSCTVTVTSTQGTATDTTDYNTVSQTLTFDSTTTERTITIQTVDDCLIEGPETFSLSLATSDSFVTVGNDAVVTIIDDDVDDCNSNPCHMAATCTNLPCNGNYSCMCNTGYNGNGTSCMAIGDDPHFSIVLPSGKLLCYTVQGEHNSIFNLISNNKVCMNAKFVPDARREEVTWIGSMGIVVRNSAYKDSNATKLRFEVEGKRIFVDDKVVLKAKNVEKLVFSNGKLTISETEGNSQVFKYPAVFIDLQDVGLTLTIKFTNQHLDLFWNNVGIQNVNSHGLIGQFFRNGVEIDQVRKLLIMPNKEPVPVMRRPVWSFMERDVPDDQLCWTAMNAGYQGKGLIDGTYKDYILQDILSEDFKVPKQ